MSRQVTIGANKGSDVGVDIQFTDTDGTPFSLFGWTVDTYDVSSEFTSPTNLITTTVTEELEGRVHVRIEWNDRLSVGIVYRFRVRLRDDPEDQTTALIGVLYS